MLMTYNYRIRNQIIELISFTKLIKKILHWKLRIFVAAPSSHSMDFERIANSNSVKKLK